MHELYRLFFAAAATPEEFVALWDKPRREEALAILAAAHDERKYKTLRRWYLGYKGWIFRRLQSVTRTMEKAEIPTYLTDQEHYNFVKQMLAQRRVRPMVVNLLETKGLQGIGEASQKLGVPIRLLYVSNAEEYWPRYPKSYRETMAALPFHEQALVLRTLLSDYVSKLEGRAARWAIQSNAPLLSRTLGQFVAVRAHVPRLRLHFGEQGLHSVSPAPHCEVPW